MLAKFFSEHYYDTNLKPSGGVASGTGFCISWQRGPLGSGDDRKNPNGAFVETIIDAAQDRLEFYQTSPFACDENAKALEYLQAALDVLNSRTQRRVAAGVEGTHKGS